MGCSDRYDYDPDYERKQAYAKDLREALDNLSSSLFTVGELRKLNAPWGQFKTSYSDWDIKFMEELLIEQSPVSPKLGAGCPK
jgi:hypothetical protein